MHVILNSFLNVETSDVNVKFEIMRINKKKRLNGFHQSSSGSENLFNLSAKTSHYNLFSVSLIGELIFRMYNYIHYSCFLSFIC